MTDKPQPLSGAAPAPECQCFEVGNDGTKNHSGGFTPIRNIQTTAWTCDNHLRNYRASSHWKLGPAAPVAVPAGPIDAWKEGNELLKKVAAPLPPPQEPKVVKVSFQRELTVWLSPDKGREQADADVSAIKDGATIFKVGTELYFNRLRLLVEQDPSLERRIAVFFTDANGIIHEIGLTKDAELKWPAGFFTEGWENEIEIGKLRRAKKR